MHASSLYMHADGSTGGCVAQADIPPYLLQAVTRRGGFAATAKAMGVVTQRRGRQRWTDVEAVADEVRRFILDTQFPAEQRHGGGDGRAGEEADGMSAGRALPPGCKMPTHRELAAAGRHDLK